MLNHHTTLYYVDRRNEKYKSHQNRLNGRDKERKYESRQTENKIQDYRHFRTKDKGD